MAKEKGSSEFFLLNFRVTSPLSSGFAFSRDTHDLAVRSDQREIRCFQKIKKVAFLGYG